VADRRRHRDLQHADLQGPFQYEEDANPGPVGAGMWWLNTTNHTLLRRNADNTAWIPVVGQDVGGEDMGAVGLTRGTFNPQIHQLAAENKKLAERKARALLMQHLNPTQRRMFEKHGHFFVKGNKTGHIYKLGPSHGVARVSPWQNYCVYVDDALPFPDSLLGLKLHIENNEAHFLEKAIKR
jgi:hypothetical protein